MLKRMCKCAIIQFVLCTFKVKKQQRKKLYMKIGIDARPLTVQNFTGIPNYVYQICKQWMEKHPEHEYYLMARKPICFKEEDLPDNWHILNTPWIIDWGKFWFMFEMPKLIKEYELDVFWGPNYMLPKKIKGVDYFVSVMDMAIFRFKHVGQFVNSLQIKSTLKSTTKKAKKIIAISESTKNDVVELMNVDPEKVVVTYIAGDSDNKIAAGTIRTEIQSLDKYFLFIGTIEPRKNIVTIVEGFEKYCDKTGDTETILVLAGGRGWNCEEIYNRVQNSNYENRIYMPGFVSDAEKDYLYKHAIAFVYPSLYEGFGMPILEAFRYNTPVITANNSSLPEVGGDAALYIDTFDSEALGMSLIKIATMENNEKAYMKEKMCARLKDFSWHKCAEETLLIIEEGNLQ